MESTDIGLIFNDNYEQERQARYYELLGHTDKHLHTPATQWTEDMFQCVVKQGKEQEELNCPAYGEASLKCVASDAINESKPATSYMKWGQVCVICFDPIVNQQNAYLTECNHAMHKACITSLWNSTNFSSMEFKCPLCRVGLTKCTWLHPRYALEPWRIPHRKKPRCNVDFESQRHLFNEDIIKCKGCPCTTGCQGYVGRNPECKACHNWRSISVSELQRHCKCSMEETKKPPKAKSRQCDIIATVYNMFWSP